jgi:hypothetical protein
MICTVSGAGIAKNAPEQTAAPAKTADPFVGRYQVWGTLDRTAQAHGKVEIRKDGADYKLIGLKSYEGHEFQRKEKNVLDGGGLGDLTLGEMKFGGKHPEVKQVVRAWFCYDHFYLVKID